MTASGKEMSSCRAGPYRSHRCLALSHPRCPGTTCGLEKIEAKSTLTVGGGGNMSFLWYKKSNV